MNRYARLRLLGSLSISIVGAFAFLFLASVALAQTSNPPSGVAFTLEGCNLPTNSATGLPEYTLPLSGTFVCNNQVWNGSNDDYTTGNLGKNWNELDLVPMRVIVGAGTSAPMT